MKSTFYFKITPLLLYLNQILNIINYIRYLVKIKIKGRGFVKWQDGIKGLK